MFGARGHKITSRIFSIPVRYISKRSNPKPNPDLLLSIMKTTRTKNIVMIGDTTYDLEMANAAGVRGIGVSWGHHSSEELRKWAPVVDSVEELVRFLKV